MGLWEFGTIAYTLMLTTITLRLALDMRYWTGFRCVGAAARLTCSHFVMWGSLGLYAVWMLFYTGIVDVLGEETTGGMYWVYYRMMSSLLFWALLVVLTVLALLPEFIIRFVACHPSHSRCPASIDPLTSSFFRRVIWPNMLESVQHHMWEGPGTTWSWFMRAPAAEEQPLLRRANSSSAV